MSWNTFLKEKIRQRQYVYRKRTKKDVLNALNAYKGLGVNECIYENSCIMESGATLISLTGTIGIMSSNENTSNVSIRIILPKRYPDIPPAVYIIPTIEANFKSSRYIDNTGKIHIPVLRNWQNATERNIVSVIEQLRHIFGKECNNCDEPSGKRLFSTAITSDNTTLLPVKYHASLWNNFFDSILQRNNQYQYRDEVKDDVLNALGKYPTLKPTYEECTVENQSENFCLCLRGTIPIFSSNRTYQIPVEIWLLPSHPYQAPIINVKPTSGMYLSPTSYTDFNGRVILPQVMKWTTSYGRSLINLIDQLKIAFERESPVCSDRITPIVFRKAASKNATNRNDDEQISSSSQNTTRRDSIRQNTTRLYPDLESEFRAKRNHRKISPDSEYYIQPDYGCSANNSDNEYKDGPPRHHFGDKNQKHSENSIEFQNLDQGAIQMTLTMQLQRNDLVAALSQ